MTGRTRTYYPQGWDHRKLIEYRAYENMGSDFYLYWDDLAEVKSGEYEEEARCQLLEEGLISFGECDEFGTEWHLTVDGADYLYELEISDFGMCYYDDVRLYYEQKQQEFIDNLDTDSLNTQEEQRTVLIVNHELNGKTYTGEGYDLSEAVKNLAQEVVKFTE